MWVKVLHEENIRWVPYAVRAMDEYTLYRQAHTSDLENKNKIKKAKQNCIVNSFRSKKNDVWREVSMAEQVSLTRGFTWISHEKPLDNTW